jgi:hypothetical protein
MKELAELERRAEEWKKTLVKPVAKRNERPMTKTQSNPQSLPRMPSEVRNDL